MISEYIDGGVGYVHNVLTFIRDGISNIIGATGFDGRLGLMIIMAIVAFLLSYSIFRRFVIKPYDIRYLSWTIIVTLLMFLLLVYL